VVFFQIFGYRRVPVLYFSGLIVTFQELGCTAVIAGGDTRRGCFGGPAIAGHSPVGRRNFAKQGSGRHDPAISNVHWNELLFFAIYTLITILLHIYFYRHSYYD